MEPDNSLPTQFSPHLLKCGVSLQALAQALDLLTDAVIIRDISNLVLFWNEGAANIYGHSREYALDRDVTTFLYGKDLAEFTAAKEATLRTGAWSGEIWKRTADARSILISSRWILIRDDHGAPELIVVVDSDLANRRQLEGEVLRAQRVESIGALTSGIAHDLNNILAPIVIGSEMLQLHQLPRESKEILGHISKCAQRGAEVVKQVLTFIRGAEERNGPLNLIPIIRDVSQFAATTFPRNIEVTWEAPPDLWLTKGNATQIHQVLLNLCINARDAMPHGGRLRVLGENVPERLPTKPQVKLTIEDSGEGIPAEVLEKIFDPFFTTKPEGRGTGLGLSTALSIIEAHGGAIRASSQPRRGTSFHILLPAEPPADAWE